jgi:hypothetical protein
MLKMVIGHSQVFKYTNVYAERKRRFIQQQNCGIILVRNIIKPADELLVCFHYYLYTYFKVPWSNQKRTLGCDEKWLFAL